MSPRDETRFRPEPLETDHLVTTSKTQHRQNAPDASARSELLLQLHLESNPEALCVVRAAVERAAEVLHFPEDQSRAIVRSVDEALANIIRHAYQGRENMPIEVSCYRLRDDKDARAASGIEIVLEDAGVAIDSSKMKSRSLNEIRPGGLGLHFIQSSMDVVEFSRKDDKNFLRLVKYLAPLKPEKTREGE